MRIRTRSRGRVLAGVCALLATLALGAAPARAERPLISSNAVKTSQFPPGQIEDACGVAVSAGAIYISDYYHRRVIAFNPTSREYLSEIATEPIDGPCGLATGPGGTLYVNHWHRSVVRLLPTELSFDTDHSTGVAVAQTDGRVYVDDRTYVAVYEPSGAQVLEGGEPLRIGLGTLGDAYGIAVSGARVYVADAADNLVKIYEPALDPVNPVATITGPFGGFTSLVDASLAVDPTNGHLIVVDNLQPGFTHPEAALQEFDAAGAYLGRASNKVIDGEPSGLAFSGSNLYATSGNDEEARVFQFGAYTLSGFAGSGSGLSVGGAAAAGPGGATDQGSPAGSTALAGSTASPVARRRAKVKAPGASASEVVQRGRLRVAFQADFTPRKLPRSGAAPVRLSVGARISTADGSEAPQLRRLTIAINREGRFDPTGLPICRISDIEPATTENALEACRDSLVGQGTFNAKVRLSRQSPFPSEGKVYAFNGRLHGRPAILAHVYGTEPVPTSYTLPFEVGRTGGTFGLVLRASLPQVTGDAAHITGLSLNLGRSFRYHGRRHSYLSAGCPAPKGFPGALFPLAKAKLAFAGGKAISTTLTRNCKVRG
jgi:DNA-binding beta-propeller fold protein YncE